MLKLLIFEQVFACVLRTLLKVPRQKIIAKFDFYVQILLILSLTSAVLKNLYLICLMLKNSYLIRLMLKNSKF